ncbi:MAG: 6-bladed beta-propeller [Balneolaceae bacterium]
MIKRGLPVWLMLVIAAACSQPEPLPLPDEVAAKENITVIGPEATPAHTLSLHREVAFGDTDDVLINRLFTGFSDDSDRFYLLDAAEHTIHVYNSDGYHLKTLGGDGEGPGEFRGLGDARIVGDTMWVLDRNLRRVSRFNLSSLSFEKAFALPADLEFPGEAFRYPASIWAVDEHSIVVEYRTAISPLDAQGVDRTIIGVLLEPETGEVMAFPFYEFRNNDVIVDLNEGRASMMIPPYGRSSLIQMQDGEIVYAWSEHALIEFYNREGVFTGGFFHHTERIPLNRSEVIAEYADRGEPWTRMIRNAEMPEHWPAIRSVVADDAGRIWFSVVTDDEETYTWRVADRDGALLGEIVRPRGHRITHIQNGYLYSVEESEEGLPHVVRYRIEFG